MVLVHIPDRQRILGGDRRRFDRFMDHTILNEVTLDVSNDPTRVLALDLSEEVAPTMANLEG